MMRHAFLAMIVLLTAAAAPAQESLDERVLPVATYNVADPDFGLNMHSAPMVDLGDASLVPIRVDTEPDTFGPGGDILQFEPSFGEDSVKIFLFRTPRPLYVRTDQSIRFRVRTEGISEVLFWPESYAAPSQWNFKVVELLGDGTYSVLYSSTVLNNQYMHVRFSRESTLEFTITLLRWDREFTRRLWLTVSPFRIYEDHNGRVMPRATYDWP